VKVLLMKNPVRFLLLLCILLYVGCGPNSCQQQPAGPPPTTGSIIVNVSYGAGSQGGGSCGDGGEVTIRGPQGSSSAASQSKPYGYLSGISNSSPACSAPAVTFGNLQPGSWTVSATPWPSSCQVSVTAGQNTVLSIQDGTCTVQPGL
jgi:hypothetical protein